MNNPHRIDQIKQAKAAQALLDEIAKNAASTNQQATSQATGKEKR